MRFVNVRCIDRYLSHSRPGRISAICMGLPILQHSWLGTPLRQRGDTRRRIRGPKHGRTSYSSLEQLKATYDASCDSLQGRAQ